MNLSPSQTEACGDIQVSLTSEQSFLELDENLRSVALLPEEGDAEGTFENAYLELSLSSAIMKVPIKIVTFSCTVNSVGFKSPSISVEYQIGSASVQEDLPSIEQKPDCGLPLNQIVVKSITSNLAEDALAAAV